MARPVLLGLLLACLIIASVLLQQWPAAVSSTGAAVHRAAGNATDCGCPSGNVSDCCCSFADLEETNSLVVHPLLQRVVATPFFSHFRVDLCSDCTLWQDLGQCILRDCAVCECEDPPAWADDAHADCNGQLVDEKVVLAPMGLGKAQQWGGSVEPSRDSAVVVDLRLNPERYTGYSGASAARVWEEIHGTCFPSTGGNATSGGRDASGEACVLNPEQRIYNRLVSGIHSSISLHIAHDYCLERSMSALGECAKWGPNATAAHEKVLRYPDRVENLYAAFAVLLRAVVKAGDAVSAAVPRDDPTFAAGLREWREALLPELQHLRSSCPKTFSEEELFRSDEGTALWGQVEGRLQRLAEAMQCVGCDRCRLWGTLQVRGLSVAARVLFQRAGTAGGGALELSRQDAVALVHTLERLSSSLEYARQLRAVELGSTARAYHA